MANKIGYQNGIEAFFNWYRKQPEVPQRGPNYNPDDINTWPWPDKLERTLKILAADHDAAIPTTPPPVEPPPPPPPTYKKVAPRTYNKVLPNGSDARFCVRGLPKNSAGRYFDEVAEYDDNGLCTNGRRSPDTQVLGLRQSNNMNGMDPCTLYGGMTAWPGDPLQNTGSWTV